MKCILFLVLFIYADAKAQEQISASFITGRWTVQWGNEYGSIPHDAGSRPVDTTDCKGDWNYDFLSDGTIRFYVNKADPFESGKWIVRDSVLTLLFDSVERSFTIKRISFTRLETSWRWTDEKTGAQTVAYLHFRRN